MRILAASTSMALLLPVLLACGSSSGGSGGSGSSAPHVCKPSTVEIDGTVEGANANGMYSGPTNYDFEQVGTGTLTVDFGTNGVLALAWTTAVPDEQSTSVTGTITMPAEGPHAGQVYCIKAGTMTPHAQSTGNGVSFSFTSLAKGACPGTAVAGTLDGCAAGGL